MEKDLVQEIITAFVLLWAIGIFYWNFGNSMLIKHLEVLGLFSGHHYSFHAFQSTAVFIGGKMFALDVFIKQNESVWFWEALFLPSRFFRIELQKVSLMVTLPQNDINAGVLQVSMLGHTLLHMFINGIPDERIGTLC